MDWLAIGFKIATAAAPLVEKLAKLIGLFGEAKARNLSIDEVEAEIKTILADSASMDKSENELAGIS